MNPDHKSKSNRKGVVISALAFLAFAALAADSNSVPAVLSPDSRLGFSAGTSIFTQALAALACVQYLAKVVSGIIHARSGVTTADYNLLNEAERSFLTWAIVQGADFFFSIKLIHPQTPCEGTRPTITNPVGPVPSPGDSNPTPS